MITATEAGLTSDVYADLKALKTNHVRKVIASRYNLDFGSSALYDNAGDNDSNTFDAIALDDYLFRVSGSGTMERFAIMSGTWETQAGFSAPSGLNPTCNYTLAAASGVLYVFASTSAGIQLNTTSDYGATYSGWSTIYSFATATNFYTHTRCIGGVATASSTETPDAYGTYEAANAFDDDAFHGWQAVFGTTSATLQYDFNLTATPTPVITHYMIMSTFKTWTFQGSNNGSSWTTLQTVTNDTNTALMREYTVSNSTAYRYYRFNVTAINGVYLNCRAHLQESTTEQSIMWIAAATPDRVHFLFCDPDYRLYNLRVIINNSGWSMSQSDIWLTKKPNSMDADTNGTSDWIVLDTEVPGRVVEVADSDNGVKNQIYSMGGLISFEYKNAQWADHVEIDVIDALSEFKYRKNVKCSMIGDKMYVIAYSSSGTEAHPFTGDRIYTTKDGRNWSNGKLLCPAALTGQSGAILLSKGDYVYALENAKTWRSYSTLYTGTIAADIQVDITQYINSYTHDHQGMFQFNMTLNNSDGWLDDHAFLKARNVVIFQHYVGGVVDGVNYTYLIATTRMDSFESDDEISGNSASFMVSVSGRDFLSSMSDFTVSEGSVEKESTLYGLDTFAPKEGTQYGGLSHIATMDGEIDVKTDSVIMKSTENLARTATGFSTFSDDIWNGIVETNFVFQGYNDPTFARAGLVFKAKDQYQNMSLTYHRDIDKLVVSINDVQPSWVSSTMSWTASSLTDNRWLRMWMYYGKLRGYSSPGGLTWTLQITAFIDMRYAQPTGAPYVRDVNSFTVVERGFVGITAHIPFTGD